jgi:hypothetical protein
MKNEFGLQQLSYFSGLVFLTYPDLVLELPFSVVWAVIFFLMLLVSLFLLKRSFLAKYGMSYIPNDINCSAYRDEVKNPLNKQLDKI